MSDWKWTTKVALAMAVGLIVVQLWGMYEYATENDLIFTPNSGGVMLNLLLWWATFKFVLDAGVWVRGKFR